MKIALSFYTVFLFTIIFTGNCFSQSTDSLYYKNADYQVAREIFKRKTVMLGDYGHEQPGPYHHLLNTLYHWLDIASSKQENFNLTLIIENDEIISGAINYYFSTGDMKTIYDKMVTPCYLENLEYFANLRSFTKKIDSVNQNRIYKIHFQVKGFEQVGSGKCDYVDNMDRYGFESWFVNGRDSVTASGVINYLKTNPKEQILMYYGEFHFIDCYFNKKNGGQLELPYDECNGFSLAHYLKDEFGKDNVLTVSHRWYYNGIFNDTPLESVKDTNIIFSAKYLNEKNNENLCVDEIISCKDIYLPLTGSDAICSRYILERIVNDVNYFNNFTGYKAKERYRSFLKGFKLLTGMSFKDVDKLNEWCKDNKYDGADWLYSDKLKDTIFKFFKKVKDSKIINSVLSEYGIGYYVKDSMMQSFDSWKDEAMNNWYKDIKFTNSIGIYWLGYPDEKIKAKEYLVQYSGQDYDEPEKYLQWYRKLCGYDLK